MINFIKIYDRLSQKLKQYIKKIIHICEHIGTEHFYDRSHYTNM